MPRDPVAGPRALTGAERQAHYRAKQRDSVEALEQAVDAAEFLLGRAQDHARYDTTNMFGDPVSSEMLRRFTLGIELRTRQLAEAKAKLAEAQAKRGRVR